MKSDQRSLTLGILYPFPLRYASSILLRGLAGALSREHGVTVRERIPGEPGGRLRWLLRGLAARSVPPADIYLGVVDVPVPLGRVARSTGKPVIGVWYDAFEDIAASPPSWRRPFARTVYRNARDCDLLLPVSAALARMGREIRGGDEGVLPLALVGADGDRFDPARTDGATARGRLGIDEGEIVVGMVGRIGGGATTGDSSNFTGRPLVRQARAIIDEAAPLKIRFLIVGFGPGLDIFRRAVEEAGVADRFVFTGGVPHEDVPNHIAAMDITVDLLDDIFASRARNETKIKEYMAMGACIVATGIGEIVRDLDDGRAGALVRPDQADLGERIVTLARNPKGRRRLGEAARRRFEEEYSWPVLAGRFMSVLGERWAF